MGRPDDVQRRLRHGALLAADAAPQPRLSRGDRLQVAFALLVLLYFAAQLLRGWTA